MGGEKCENMASVTFINGLQRYKQDKVKLFPLDENGAFIVELEERPKEELLNYLDACNVGTLEIMVNSVKG